MPRPIKISLIIAAAEASERLSSYGYNVERVAFNADGLVMTGLSHDNIYTYLSSVEACAAPATPKAGR